MKKGTSILNNYTDELKELYLNSDLPLEKIGEIYNVSRETVTNFAKRQGWYGLRQDAPRATYQLNQEYLSNQKLEELDKLGNLVKLDKLDKLDNLVKLE